MISNSIKMSLCDNQNKYIRLPYPFLIIIREDTRLRKLGRNELISTSVIVALDHNNGRGLRLFPRDKLAIFASSSHRLKA